MLHAIADPVQRGDHSSESWAFFVPYHPSWLMMSTSQIQCFCHIGVDLSLSMEIICSLRAGLVCWVPQPWYGICFLYIRWLTSSLENSAPWPSMHLGPGPSLGGCATRCLELKIKQSSEQVSICKTKTSWRVKSPTYLLPLMYTPHPCYLTSMFMFMQVKWGRDEHQGILEGGKCAQEPYGALGYGSHAKDAGSYACWTCHLPSHHLSWELVLCPTNTQC